jgi:hypothetical protein
MGASVFVVVCLAGAQCAHVGASRERHGCEGMARHAAKAPSRQLSLSGGAVLGIGAFCPLKRRSVPSLTTAPLPER